MHKNKIHKKRKWMQSRSRRRRHRKNAVGCMIFFALVVIAFGMAGKASRKLSEMDAALTAETTIQGSVLQEETMTGGTEAVASETTEARLKRVARKAEEQGVPQAVIDLLEKNPETVGFVENYGNSETNAEIKSAELNTEGGRNGIPLYIQWDERWGYESFGTSIIGVSGCGATCMAMVVAGLTGDDTVTPDVMASYEAENGYIDADNNTYWSFLREGGAAWNISAEQGMLSETKVSAELSAGHPIICSMGPGDFTDGGHFIVLVAYADGNVTVNDPFSLANSGKTWVFADIQSQIKNMWVFQAGN